REALQKRQAAERKALSAKLPRQEVWRTWLEREAAQGDEAAQAALRGIRYREQRNKNKAVDGIEGEELDPLRKLTLAGLQAQIDQKRQLVLYRGTDGREKFTDTGPRIVMHDKSDESLEAALRMAAQKFGGKVDITGSAEFRERAARKAVRLGIEVVDADLQHVVADERARMQQALRPGHRELSPSAVENKAPSAD
ncbi:MAG: LPD7 domain-containing protein, partial [Thiomonas sp.]